MVGLGPVVPMTLVMVHRVRGEELLLARDLADIENTGVRSVIAL
jgi:hypothetical protein